MVLWSVLPMMVYMRKKTVKYALHSITYSIFSLLMLSWIPCYAILTLNNNSWLTRGGRKEEKKLEAVQVEKLS